MTNNLIQQELKKASEFSFSKKGDLLELSLQNVALVEAMISNDSDYWLSNNPEAAPSGNYKGSTAYWMVQLKRALQDKSRNCKEIILQAVLAVDRENSTHIAADGCGPKVLTERIYAKKSQLIDILKDRKKGFKFIEDLSKPTFEGTNVQNGKTYYPRENYSFATKFCHYACFHFFEGEEWQDNYSIFDGVVCAALPDYLAAAKIEKQKGKPYAKSDFSKAKDYPLYSEMIDKLRNNKISRNGFDHLLWYYHKARMNQK